MAKLPNPFSRIKIEFHRSRAVTKIMVIVAIVLSTAALVTLRLAQMDIREQTDALRQEAAYLEYEYSDLQDRVDNLDSVQSVEQIAREELGLVDPDTVIFETEQ